MTSRNALRTSEIVESLQANPEDLRQLIECIGKIGKGEDVDVDKVKVSDKVTIEMKMRGFADKSGRFQADDNPCQRFDRLSKAAAIVLGVPAIAPFRADQPAKSGQKMGDLRQFDTADTERKSVCDQLSRCRCYWEVDESDNFGLVRLSVGRGSQGCAEENIQGAADEYSRAGHC